MKSVFLKLFSSIPNPRSLIYNPFIVIIPLLLLFSNCNNDKNNKPNTVSLFNKDGNDATYDTLDIGMQTIEVTGVKVDIAVPDGKVNGDILVLPGWNFSKDKWCSDSDLCAKALAKGYRLIMPEMGLSVYATHYFPQTRADWANAPTGVWVADTLIRYLQGNYNVLSLKSRNFIVGLSTGGRGVVMTALRTGTLFKAGASLSGDFDQSQTPYDAVMTGFYGSYDEFRDLWENTDNPIREAAKLKVPLYLGHGLQDYIVPNEQTQSFYKKLKEYNPGLKVVMHLSDTGMHDFNYWNTEVDPLLNFFDEF